MCRGGGRLDSPVTDKTIHELPESTTLEPNCSVPLLFIFNMELMMRLILLIVVDTCELSQGVQLGY